MRRPVAWFGLAFTLGQLLAVYVPPVACLLPAALLFCVILLRNKIKFWEIAAVILLALFSALVHHALYDAAFVSQASSLDGKTCHLTGYVVSTEEGYSDGYQEAVVKCDSLDYKRTNCKIVISNLPFSKEGEEFSGNFSLTFESDKNNLADGIILSGEYQSDYSWGDLHQPIAALYNLKRTLSSNVKKYLPQEPYASIASAITLGDSAGLDYEVRNIFRRAGVSHLLVVSGLHMSLLCSLFFIGDQHDGRKRKYRALACGVFVPIYMAIVGFTPSVCRAGLCILILCFARYIWAPADSLTSLSVAAILICLSNPYAVFDIGFELSFLATASVLHSSEFLRKLYERYRILTKHKVCRGAISVSVISFSAALAVLPIQLFYGFTISGVGILSNLLVSAPFVPLLILCFANAIFGGVALLKGPCLLLGIMAGLIIKYILIVLSFVAHLPWASLVLPREFTLLVLLIACILYLVFCNLNLIRYGVASLAFLLIFSIVFSKNFSANTAVIALVGSGNSPCAVVTYKNEAWVIFRGGTSNRHQVKNYLESCGISDSQVMEWVYLSQLGTAGDVSDSSVDVERLSLNRWSCEEQEFGKIYLLNQKSGNAALIDVFGGTMLVTAGSPEFPSALTVDTAVLSSTENDMVNAAVWLKKSKQNTDLQDARHLVSGGIITVEANPAYGMRLRKGEHLFEKNELSKISVR